MSRVLLLVALVVVVSATPAGATEMFTSFHYGQNVGFPPMQVPIEIYGPGGWNCGAMGCVAVPSGLPAQMPTGCNRGTRPSPRKAAPMYFPGPEFQHSKNDTLNQNSESRKVAARPPN